MFENIIAQNAAEQLKKDILSNRLAPAMLFYGPVASGKSSTAIEFARAVSCENKNALWNCSCSNCVLHRTLRHPDLAMIGCRGFAAEISAAKKAFLRDPASAAGRLLFIRSLKKLTARFSPVVWEYESKSGKINPYTLLQELDENINEIESLVFDSAETENQYMESKEDTIPSEIERISNLLENHALKLIDENFISESIPIGQVRKIAYWSHLSPERKKKVLIIENTDRMEEKARNSLLKLLEEPPETINIILIAQRRESVSDTILSRLRPYKFITRNNEQEKDIIKRVFRNPYNEIVQNNKIKTGLVEAYLDSFSPQSSNKLIPLAAFFIAAVMRSAVTAKKKRGSSVIPYSLVEIGKYCSRITGKCENKFEPAMNVRQTIPEILKRSENFQGRSFPLFLVLILDLISESLTTEIPANEQIVCRDIWKKNIKQANEAYSIFNIRPEPVLELLFCRLGEELAAAI